MGQEVLPEARLDHDRSHRSVTAAKALIVNADDFGHSREVNAGVIRAHEQGIVTSTSLMVQRPAVEEAAAYARSRPQLAVGLHVEPGTEVEDQLERFVALVGRDPTHVDSHKHAHLSEPLLSAVTSVGRRLAVPVRHLDPRMRYLGSFHGEAVSAANLCAIVRSLGDGITELGCHPAVGAVPGSSYSVEREQELEALCDQSVRMALDDAGVELRSFADVA